MSLYKDIFSVATVPFISARNLLKIITAQADDSLRILLYHDIEPFFYAQFEKQLRFLLKTHRFISPEEFALYFEGKLPLTGKNLLLTFDDGFYSNRIVAERILGPLGIKALFFVISDFVELENLQEAKKFIAEKIQPGRDIYTIPDELYNMSWQDLQVLLHQGHTIGAHTKSHVQLSKVKSEEELEREIITSARFVERKLGIVINDFAFPYGNIQSITPLALSVARKKFSRIYSGLRGNNIGVSINDIIRREATATSDSLLHLYSFINGGVDFKYSSDINQIKSWYI